MDKVQLKHKLHSLIDSVEDEASLQRIETVVQDVLCDEGLSIAQWQEIEAALADVQAGRYSSHEAVMAKVQAWRSK